MNYSIKIIESADFLKFHGELVDEATTVDALLDSLFKKSNEYLNKTETGSKRETLPENVRSKLNVQMLKDIRGIISENMTAVRHNACEFVVCILNDQDKRLISVPVFISKTGEQYHRGIFKSIWQLIADIKAGIVHKDLSIMLHKAALKECKYEHNGIQKIKKEMTEFYAPPMQKMLEILRKVFQTTEIDNETVKKMGFRQCYTHTTYRIQLKN